MQIDLPYACFGIVIKSNVIVEAPPIARWMIGRQWKSTVERWVRRKGGICVKLLRENSAIL